MRVRTCVKRVTGKQALNSALKLGVILFGMLLLCILFNARTYKQPIENRIDGVSCGKT